MRSKQIKVKDSVEAWEVLNEMLALKGDEVIKQGGFIRGNQTFLYFTDIEIKRIRANPDFDFGFLCGYTNYKWTSLVNNYLDFAALEELKKEVNKMDKDGMEYYSTFMNFVNTSKQGHSCLMSLSCCRYTLKGEPVVIVNTRATEATKRFLMDLVLVQRIVEYIYGTNKIKVYFHALYSFITPESFVMYHNHRNVYDLVKENPKQEDEQAAKWVATIKKTLDDLLSVDESTVKYKVMRRAVRQLQLGEDGKPMSKRKPLLVKDLKIFKKIVVKETVINKTTVMYPISAKVPKEIKIKKEKNVNKDSKPE